MYDLPVNTNITVGGNITATCAGSNDWATGITLTPGENAVQKLSVDGSVKVSSKNMANGISIYAGDKGTADVMIGKGLEVSGEWSSPEGILISSRDDSVVNLTVNEGVSVFSSGSEKRSEAVIIHNSSSVNLNVTGDVTSDHVGISPYINSDKAITDIVVDGTISAETAAVELNTSGALRGAYNEDDLKLTVWKIDLNENGNAVEVYKSEYQQEEDTAPIAAQKEASRSAVEKNIMYIIKVEQPRAGATLTAAGEGGATLAKSHDFDVAKEGENVYLKVDVQDGYKLTGAYNGLGEKVPLMLDAASGNYYVTVPKGGGIYLSAVLEKLPDPEPEPEPGPEPEPKPEPDPEPETVPTPVSAVSAVEIKFDLDGGTLNGETGTITKLYCPGQKIRLPEAPIKEDCEFDGWETRSMVKRSHSRRKKSS